MNTIKLFIALALLSTVLCADDYSDVLKAIDAMIAQEEQKKHFMAHLSDIDHSHDAPLPHDLAYSPEYSVKDLTDGIAYVSALRGAGKPKTPIFTDKDKSDFARADVPSQKLSQQEGLHQTLLQNTNLLNNPQKENELKKSTLNSLIEEEQHLQNPLHDIPVFNTTQTPKNFVLECTLDMENGVPCPGGKCFNGKCKPDQPCYDDCCDSKKFALPDGAPCKGGNCLRGRCRAFPLCIGECCESSLPKPNGTPCTQGHCFEGGCVSDVGCVSGVCCNTYTGRLFPKGFPCHVSDCQQKSFCNGVSSYCPETAPKEDGSICVGGTCNKGVCALSGVVSTTNEICSSGVCCNNSTHTYKPAGTPCSNNPCMTGGACTGYSSECSASFKAVADGTACTGGTCQNGVCIASTPVVAATPETVKLSELNQKQADDMDIALAELDAKISKAKHRQELLEKAMKQHKVESNRRFLRSALDLTHKKLKSEYELARRSVYPYQITSTPEQLFDTGAHDFSVHEYVRQLAQEKHNFDKNLYSKSASILQSSTSTKSTAFPFALVGGIVLIVIALVLIVFIFKTAGGNKSNNHKDEDYDNF